MSRPATCPREPDVIAAVTSGRWPLAADETLRAHVASCEVCAEARAMAELMRSLERETLQDARLPSAGQVWWRAQLRARREAQAAAARPVLVAQGLGAAVVLGLIAALISWQWPVLAQAAGEWLHQPVVALELSRSAWSLLGAAGILGPLAIYWALARE